MSRLYHVSDDGGIELFEPRVPPSKNVGIDYPCVWGISEERLVNYLLPRDCPRVTYYAKQENEESDTATLMGPGRPRCVVAIEEAWLERATEETLYLYGFDGDSFECVDEGAGYWVSRMALRPFAVYKIEKPLMELTTRGAELRVVASLWPVRDAVLESSLQFSFIRMRNAKPRSEEGVLK
ncbi:MAG: DUF6886 family protein [Verrucomicrobiota bacterium]